MTTTNTRATTGVAARFDETSLLWRLKVRLQFTGWLQYLPPLLGATASSLLAGLLWLAGAPAAAWKAVAALAALAAARFAWEVVTVRLGVRPTEAVPPPRADVGVFDLMRARRSCRSFQRRNLTPEHHAAVMASVRAHTQPARLLGQSPIRFEYVAAPLTVWPAVGAHEFLVAIAPHAYDRTAVIDVGRSLQHVVIEATRLGIATCWIGPGADHISIERHLGQRFDRTRDHIICVCALGYPSRFIPLLVRAMSRQMSTRLPLDTLFFDGPGFAAPLDVSAPAFSKFGRCFEACQWSPSSYNGQTTRCVGVAEGDRARRFDFYAATSSRYYAAVALGIWLANWELGCEALGQAGHFEVLSAEVRGAIGAPALPHYDVSWVVQASRGAASAMVR